MLTHDQLATVRAALLFWQEEICPHGAEVSFPYLDVADTAILSAEAVAKLRTKLTTASVRYVLVNPERVRLASSEMFDGWDLAVQNASASMLVATVLLP